MAGIQHFRCCDWGSVPGRGIDILQAVQHCSIFLLSGIIMQPANSLSSDEDLTPQGEGEGLKDASAPASHLPTSSVYA